MERVCFYGQTEVSARCFAFTIKLIEEGMARDLIRAIKAHRKELNLPMNMCIDIGVATDEALHVVVEKIGNKNRGAHSLDPPNANQLLIAIDCRHAYYRIE